MKFKIIVDIEDCPYKGKKTHYMCNMPFHKCKHPDGDGKCYSNYSRVHALCPIAISGDVIE